MKSTSASILFCTLLATHAVPASAWYDEPYTIKGYALGQEFNRCPDGTKLVRDGTIKMCNLGKTTFAGFPVTRMALAVVDQEIIGVMLTLQDQGANANSLVYKAMEEKFGRPNPYESKKALNRYTWTQTDVRLTLDGLRGNVVLVNTVKYDKATKLGAEKAASDM